MDWFRMYHEFASDAKVQSMPEAMQRRLLMLFCLRCSNTLVTLQDDEIAFALRISVDELNATKALFIHKNFVNEEWEILQWNERQFVSDSSAPRVKKHRERKKVASQKAVVDTLKSTVKHGCNVTLTPQNRTEQIQNRTDTEAPSGAVIAAATAAGGDGVGDQPDPPPKADPIPACPVGEIVNAYHDLMPLNPKVRVLDDARKKAIRARWREAAVMTIKPFGYATSLQGMTAWKQFFEVCAESQFLTGRAAATPGKPPFVADIDFLLSPSGFKKCLENKYHRDAS